VIHDRTVLVHGKYNVSYVTRARFRVAMVVGALAGSAIALLIIVNAVIHTDYASATAVPSLVGFSVIVAAALILVPPVLLNGLWSVVYRRYRERWE
jgi:hypothetical protein